MKKMKWLLAAGWALLANITWANPEQNQSVYQVSTVNALIDGLFQGAVSFDQLAKHGDFGLGSIENMDGELIALDGQFYRIKPDGKMELIPSTQTTPYAIVTFFHPESATKLKPQQSYLSLIKTMKLAIENKNIPQAIHIKGIFDFLELRAVRGAKPPYPKFSELAKKQAIFKLRHVEGDVVGFYYPIYLSKLNTPGYHLHFITKDRTTGGHVLRIRIHSGTLELMPLHQLDVVFPTTAAFAANKQLNQDNLPLMKSAFGVGASEIIDES